MCVNCEKKMLNIYRQGKTFTDQFYVDEDYNVPDTKADIREIIAVSYTHLTLPTN